MLLQCIKAFGHDKPGDFVEVPEGSGFDHRYYAEVIAEPAPSSKPRKSTSNAEESE